MYIRDEENLTTEQVKYLKRFSFGPFVFAPLYAIARQNWLFLLIFWLPRIFDKTSILFSLLEIIALGLSLFYCFIGRRMSWNMCSWENYGAFERSENNWNLVGMICTIIVLAIALILIVVAIV